MSDLSWAKEWIEKQEFVYAKSYADTFPHYYTTRNRCNVEEFEMFLSLVRKYGKVKTFYKKQYIYLEIDGYEYWEMGRPIKAVQVLNKAPINDSAKYRFPEVTENEAIQLKETLQKREEEIIALINKPEKSLKDHQVLSFLLNSERRTPKERKIEVEKYGSVKNVIDHSKIKIRYE